MTRLLSCLALIVFTTTTSNAGPTEPLASSSPPWVCTAEGASSYGFGVAAGDRHDVRGTQRITTRGTAATRTVAVNLAIRSCDARMTVQLGNQRAMMKSDDRGQWGAAITAACRITDCVPPASAREALMGPRMLPNKTP